ncbi:6-bladed beta-propeller [Algoriphagus hitonicola]|uniref:6-bladed beta-propeller protein n=1 Tax=Algoriphagus hitonicola TaxID=435880 RepID=A0A1I2W3K1_9BACT|nr:6-bladed beta-propeller [Algoriphagus hitonicola]SFG95960.1 hypothetical protein SAMN04487988_111131 [Algoriphagus hitonicola]
MTNGFYIYFFLCFQCIVVISSCSSPLQNKDFPTVIIPDRVDQNVYLSDIADSIIQIHLETNEQSLLSVIKDVVFYKNKIYINDGIKILGFDNKGNFLFKLGQEGDGPGEYGVINSFEIDRNSGLIYVSSLRKLIVFSSDHKFIRERRLPSVLNYLSFIDGSLVAISEEVESNSENKLTRKTKLYQLNSKLTITDSTTFRNEKIDTRAESYYRYKFYISVNDSENYLYKPSFYKKHLQPDTLYRLNGLDFSPFKGFDFERAKEFNPNGRINPVILNISHSESYIICEYQLDADLMFYMEERGVSKSYNLKTGFQDNDGTLVVLRPIKLSNDTFYYIKKPEYEKGSKIELNPIIGIVKLK